MYFSKISLQVVRRSRVDRVASAKDYEALQMIIDLPVLSRLS